VAGHIVFVRFIPGYSGTFPYDRFLCVKDEQIAATVAALCDEGWKDPANRIRLKDARAERMLDNLELEKYSKQWKGYLARREHTLSVPRARRLAARAKTATRKGKPTLPELMEVEGWSVPSTLQVFLPPRISKHFPLSRFDSVEKADAVSGALQVRVAELKKGAFKKNHGKWDDSAVL